MNKTENEISPLNENESRGLGFGLVPGRDRGLAALDLDHAIAHENEKNDCAAFALRESESESESARGCENDRGRSRESGIGHDRGRSASEIANASALVRGSCCRALDQRDAARGSK